MTKLSVNVNKIATIRNARGGNNPDVVQTALKCVQFGADGITVHPRPDQRHIRTQDVYDLAKVLKVEFNIEGYPNEEFLRMVEDVKPAQCTLVPDPPGVLTSNAGWDTVAEQGLLKDVCARLKAAGVRSSIFIETDLKLFDAAKSAGADRVELYTEPYAEGYTKNRKAAITPFRLAAAHAREIGLGINAGHDLSLENLHFLYQKIPYIDEVSIGHALICDALDYGLEDTIRRYQACLGNPVNIQ